MRAKDIILGESYRHRDHPNYGWARAIKVLPQKKDENTLNKIVVRCEWSVDKDSALSITKYFLPRDLTNAKE